MGNESCSGGLEGSVGNTEMGYQQQLMLHIGLHTVKNAHRKEKQHFAPTKATSNCRERFFIDVLIYHFMRVNQSLPARKTHPSPPKKWKEISCFYQNTFLTFESPSKSNRRGFLMFSQGTELMIRPDRSMKQSRVKISAVTSLKLNRGGGGRKQEK